MIACMFYIGPLQCANSCKDDGKADVWLTAVRFFRNRSCGGKRSVPKRLRREPNAGSFERIPFFVEFYVSLGPDVRSICFGMLLRKAHNGNCFYPLESI
jgi:hypothetical protein